MSTCTHTHTLICLLAAFSPSLARHKVEARRCQAESRLAQAHRCREEADAALAKREWGAAIEAASAALTALGSGPAAAGLRADVLCTRAEAWAAVQEWDSALADATFSVQLRRTSRGEAALSRLTVYVRKRRQQQQREGSSIVHAAEATGLSPGAASIRSFRVTASCAVSLREVYLCTTGGRVWQAALLLANHLLAFDRSGCRALPQLVDQATTRNPRVLEVGAGLGLVGLALAHALAHAGVAGRCSITLTDCDLETLDNLRQEIVLNSHRIIRAEPPHPEKATAMACCGIAVAELDYGPDKAFSSSLALAPTLKRKFDLVVGSDTIFSENHASLGIALANLISPTGQAIFCLPDKRKGINGFCKVCAEKSFVVDIVPIDNVMLAAAQTETDDEDLGEERPHSLYFVRWADS
jgi:predicted nicotinamide N-methyase